VCRLPCTNIAPLIKASIVSLVELIVLNVGLSAGILSQVHIIDCIIQIFDSLPCF
jgi:hypothetical protein